MIWFERRHPHAGGAGRGRYVAAALVLALFPSLVDAQASGVVRGVVVDAGTKIPVAAAQARLAEAHRAEPTHDDGVFILRNVAPGSYALTVQRLGYEPQTRRIEVRGGDTVAVRLELVQAAV